MITIDLSPTDSFLVTTENTSDCKSTPVDEDERELLMEYEELQIIPAVHGECLLW